MRAWKRCSKMDRTLDSAQRTALLALDLGVLRKTPHGWLAVGGLESHVLSVGVVRWLFGERYVEPIPASFDRRLELAAKQERDVRADM